MDEETAQFIPDYICENCKDAITNGDQIIQSGLYYCQDCFDNLFSICPRCDRIVLQDSMEEVEGDDYCQRCYNHHSYICDCCSVRYMESHDSWGNMCSSCAEDHFICEGCGGTCHNDESNEDGYCENCANGHQIHRYHQGSKQGLCFHPNNYSSDTLYLGVELETDHYRLKHNDTRDEASEEFAEIQDDERLFWLEEDSSLDNGIEIISQPCTLEYHLTKFPWKEITDIARSNGAKSHQAQTCGLHIHFPIAFLAGPRQHNQVISLIYIFERFWEQLTVFSRRTQEQLSHNSKKYNNDLANKSARDKVYELSNSSRYDRYQAVNLQTHKSTIEIRLFRGTLKLSTLYAALELVDFLARFIKVHPTSYIKDMTWANLINRIPSTYHYLHQYLIDRGLTDSKWGNITSTETEVEAITQYDDDEESNDDQFDAESISPITLFEPTFAFTYPAQPEPTDQ
uniref:Putative amidoligase enzyme n=1 Tax=viral metagenome TaxID=1070528 RepID=A0A6M3JL09_9ZZZZ